MKMMWSKLAQIPKNNKKEGSLIHWFYPQIHVEGV